MENGTPRWGGKKDSSLGREEEVFLIRPAGVRRRTLGGGGLSLSGQVDNRTLEGKEEVFLKGI